MLNPQRPFAFRSKKINQRRIKVRRTGYSENIVGICPACGRGYQRVKEFKEVCEAGVYKTIKIDHHCSSCLHKTGALVKVLKLPKNMIPWKFCPPRNTGYNGYDLIPFICFKCKTRYINFRIFGALCVHKNHYPPAGYVCRFCCTKEDTETETEKNQQTQKQQAPGISVAELEAIAARPFVDNAPIFVEDIVRLQRFDRAIFYNARFAPDAPTEEEDEAPF